MFMTPIAFLTATLLKVAQNQSQNNVHFENRQISILIRIISMALFVQQGSYNQSLSRP